MIQKKEQFLASDSFSYLSQSAELPQHCDLTRKLKKLSPAEAVEFLIKYFNKMRSKVTSCIDLHLSLHRKHTELSWYHPLQVVGLREVERQLRLRCEELELQADEQAAALSEMEAAMQHLVLDADRRLTQQHREYQNNIQLLLQKLKRKKCCLKTFRFILLKGSLFLLR